MGVQVIPEVFKSPDTVFHYCTTHTAIENILYEKRLRLSPRTKSNDPIESIVPTAFWSGNPEYMSWRKKFMVNNLRIKKYTQAKQVCFCRNSQSEEFNGMGIKPEEFYGFLKPRMWDQYGNNYNGVCLAFSLEALKKKGKGILFNPVEYVRYNILQFNNQSIEIHGILKNGMEGYLEKYLNNIEQVMFRKHIDYQGEDEYRAVSFSTNEFDYIDIEDCLVGIITPNKYRFENTFVNNTLSDYAAKYKSQLLYLKWADDGISIETKESAGTFDKMINELIELQVKSKDQNISDLPELP